LQDSDKIFEWLRKAHYAKRDALAASDKIRHKKCVRFLTLSTVLETDEMATLHSAQKRLDRLGYTSIE